MAIEIERKYLVLNDEYKRNAQRTLYRQGYISVDLQRVVRVRITGDRAFLTIKSLVSETTRLEFEYDIPVSDAAELLDKLCTKPIIEKYRYELTVDDQLWIVDEFLGDNAGLVVAEIELESEDQPFTKPSWAGTEVSADPRYLNARLAIEPFKFWNKKSK
ncbi:MAG TPA: adenylate cyclase [Candidatus Marinimicrobia bacterium]|nr:adenylate cyclase [Candidatus Neomarinimicrobiota bacterium]